MNQNRLNDEIEVPEHLVGVTPENTWTAIEAVESAMNEVWDICIEPMHRQITTNEGELVGAAGETLKIVAEKAFCFELYLKGEPHPDSLN